MQTIFRPYSESDAQRSDRSATDRLRHRQKVRQAIREYIEDPSIGLDWVEALLDAAHGLSLNCRRHRAILKLTPVVQKERALAHAEPPDDPYAHLYQHPEPEEPDLTQIPLEPKRRSTPFYPRLQPLSG